MRSRKCRAHPNLATALVHWPAAQLTKTISSAGCGGILIARALTGPLVTIAPAWGVPLGIMSNVPGLNSLRSAPSHMEPLPSMMYWISSVLGWICFLMLPDCTAIVALSVTTNVREFISGLAVVG